MGEVPLYNSTVHTGEVPLHTSTIQGHIGGRWRRGCR